MRTFLLACVALVWASAAHAQAVNPCLAVGGVNNVPVPGLACAMASTMPTYAASTSGFAVASTATDVACLTGSATRTVRVQKVWVTGSAASTLAIPVSLFIRTAADSAGTAVVMTPFAFDSNNVASTVSNAQYFTGNPTINDTAQQMVDVAEILLPTTTTSAYGVTAFDYSGALFSQAPVLRGTAQQLCVNFNKTSPSSSLVNVNFRWTEFPQ